MSIRVALIAVLLAGPACAAPLCRDTKGLYTPCAPGQGVPKARAVRTPAKPAAATASASAPAASAPAPAAGATPSAPPAASPAAETRRPLVTHIRKLCRDSKGLYTPCPR